MLSEKILYWFSRPVVRTYTNNILKMDVQMEDELPKGAKIIAANHPTTTDPFFVASMVRQQAFILINELLFNVPILGEYLRRAGHIPVKAGEGQAALERALEYLKNGKTVIIFPEGALSPLDGGLQKARTGVARLALMSGAPVYPVGIHLQKERIRTIKSTVKGTVDYGRWYLRGPYHMTVGKPLKLDGDVEDRPSVRQAAEAVMERIAEMVRQSEERFFGKRQLPGGA